jgi:hypothetical protein
MKRRRVILSLALVAVVVILAVAGLVALVAPGPVYTVGQVRAELAHNPRAWVGRTVYVRGVFQTMSWGTGHGLVAGQQALLTDGSFSTPIFSSSYGSPPIFTRSYGSPTLQFNGAGLPAVLFLNGAMPRPSPLKNLAILMAQLPLIARLFGPCPECGPDVYRVRLLNNGPCRAGFSGFCPHGMAL